MGRDAAAAGAGPPGRVASALHISAHILPRRVVLWSIVLAALGLRLWGLAWGPAGAGALHPGEWTWQIIQHLSWERPTYPGLWTQTFFTLAAMVNGVLGVLSSGWQVLLGQVHSAAEVAGMARLAGRLTVAFLGTLQVLVVYLVGRRFFDSVATGLVAAALVAVSPLTVTHSHYLSLDVPLGLAILFCLWAAWWMMDRPRLWVMAVAGLVMGLAITTRASGALMLLAMAGAYYLGLRRARPAPSRSLAAWPGGFGLGLILGLALGYPGFILASDRTAELLAGSLSLPPLTGEGWWSFFTGRLSRAVGVLGQGVGLELMLLWAVGVAMCVRRRKWGRLLIALVPPVYLLAGLVVLRGSLEGLAAAWLPAMAPLVAWPLVLLCRRLPRYSWAVAGVSLLGVLFCLWPLWRSLGAGYLFWQESTFSSAGFWVSSNLPPGARLWLGPRTPLGVFSGAKPWREMPAPDKLEPGRDYLVLSSLSREHDADPWEDWTPPKLSPELKRAAADMQLVRTFDLKSGWGQAAPGAATAFPRWVSPRVEVRAAVPPLKVLQPLALCRPAAGADRPYAMVYTDRAGYGRDGAVMKLKRDQMRHRVLFNRAGIPGLTLVLVNYGEDLIRLRVRQGPWDGGVHDIYPGQELDLALPGLVWPPMNRACRPVRVRLIDGGGVMARVLWDPQTRARRALEAGRFAEVLEVLGPLTAGEEGGFEARTMLAEALVRLGRFPEAGKALEPLERVDGGQARRYQDLALASDYGEAWARRFTRFTGYHHGLLNSATALRLNLGGPACRDSGGEVPVKGSGFHGAYIPDSGKGGAQLRLWLDDPLPPGQFEARFKFGLTADGGGEQAVLAEVWSHGQGGSRVVAAQRSSRQELIQGGGRLALPLTTLREGARLELRLSYPPGRPLNLDWAELAVDLPAHMRHMLRWYLDAKGRVALEAKRYPEAEEAFGQLLNLDPGFRAAYLPSARALWDMGKVDLALSRVRGVERLFFDQPGRLAQVAELYKQMQKPEDAARVQERLAHLRPSLKREARFAGGLTLLGYDLSASQVAPGGTVDVSYYWRCWRRPALNYFIFVHLLGEGRRLTYDHLLDHGRINMTNLEEGQVVREDYRIRVPDDLKPGRYRLVLGLWDPQYTSKAAPVVEGAGKGTEEVEVAVIEVRPRGADQPSR